MVPKGKDGGVTLTPRDEEFERQLKIGRDLTKHYRTTLRKLAK